MHDNTTEYKATWRGKDFTSVRPTVGGNKVDVQPNKSITVSKDVANRLGRERDWEIEGLENSKYKSLNPEEGKKTTGKGGKKTAAKNKKTDESTDDENDNSVDVEAFKKDLEGKTDEEIEQLLKDNDIVAEGTRDQKIEALVLDYEESSEESKQ